MQKSTPTADLLSDELRFLIACCQAEPTEDLALNADTPVVKTKVGCDTDLIRSYLSQSDNTHPSRHPREGEDPQSQSETGTPSSSTPIGDPQSQSDKHQNLITAASQHGVLPLVYKTLKKLSESNSSLLELNSDTPVAKAQVGCLTPSSSLAAKAAPAPSSSTPIGDPQSQSNKHQNLIAAASQHGILPLVYKTLKRLSEEGLLRDPSDVNSKTHNEQPQSDNTPVIPDSIRNPQSQSDTTHDSRITNHQCP